MDTSSDLQVQNTQMCRTTPIQEIQYESFKGLLAHLQVSKHHSTFFVSSSWPGSGVVGPFEFLVMEVGSVRAFIFQTFDSLVFDGVELGQRKVVKVLLSPPDFGVLQNGHRLFGNAIFVLGFSNVVLKNE